MNLIEVLKEQASKQADRAALIHGNRSLSYAQLEQESQKLAQVLQKSGVRSGQKVLVFVPLSLSLYLFFLAIVRLGAVVVFIDPALGKKKLSAAIACLKPDIFLGSTPAQVLRFLPAIREIPQKFWAPGLLIQAQNISKKSPSPDFDAPSTHPALITFTSGSTGVPKAISRSHGFLMEQNRVIQRSLALKASDIELNTLPVFVLSSLASGLTVLLVKHNSQFPRRALSKILGQIRHYQVKQILTSPNFLQQLSSELKRKQQTLPAIERIFTGGAPIFANLLQDLQQFFPQAQVTTVYGSTEAEPIAHHQLARGSVLDRQSKTQIGLLAGKPIPEIQLAILPDQDGKPLGKLSLAQFESQLLPANKVGEIVVTGDHVQKSYLHGQESLIKFTVEGKETQIWHRTGDAGYLDEQEQLWLLGRCSAKIKHQNQILYPFALEAQAMSLPEVKQAALVQLNDELVLAISTDTQEPEQLKQALAQQMPQVKRIEILPNLPTDSRHHSKILYQELIQQLEGNA